MVQNNLGAFYALGYGVEQNAKYAFDLVNYAEEIGSQYVMVCIGYAL